MLHIIQNDPEVPPGNLAETLVEQGIPFRLHRLCHHEPLPPLADISTLIVLGGAMGANDDTRYPFLSPLKQLIATVVQQEIPYLGICLGGQLLAAALKTAVISCRWEELGTLEVQLTEDGRADQLFAGIPTSFRTFQWHHDSFDLPAGALLLASSTACPHQAFRVGANAWGLQFHPEVTETIIRAWCAWDPATACRTEELITDFLQHQPAYRTVSRLMLGNLLRQR